MSAWDKAANRTELEDDDLAQAVAPIREPERMRARTDLPPSPAYVITDRFDLGSIDFDPTVGAVIRVRQLSRLEIMEIMRDHAPSVVSLDERGQSFLEKELHLAPGPRPMLTQCTKLIVAKRIAWNDVRWYLLDFIADGDGVVD